MLINLLSNAIKFSPENSEIRIIATGGEGELKVSVSDSGIGISEQDQVHLFERFFRVDKSRSREQGGSGLGLSIVKHIIEAHHQTINVRSTIGVGTAFAFTLQKAEVSQS